MKKVCALSLSLSLSNTHIFHTRPYFGHSLTRSLTDKGTFFSLLKLQILTSQERACLCV